ncbi:MAG: biotin transporter BioY [Chloroflexi bacterium]|nr:biotin transporter BioY [Chloroflexota bacterium]
MQSTLHPTLIQNLWPRTSRRVQMAQVVMGSLLVALAAQVTIPLPFSPVPITGQTFAVLLVAALLGGRGGAAALLLYLTEGALGLPVFAGGLGGPAVLLGPTAGYLYGFVVAAFVVGRLCERGWDRRLLTAAAAMLLGNAIIYGFGLPWLAAFVGAENALSLGLLPFIPGDILKLALAALSLPLGWKLLAKTR